MYYRSEAVYIGSIPLGGDHPVRIQSMVNTDTLDVEATCDQVIRLHEAGCDYVRLTVPSMREVACLAKIKHRLFQQNCHVPLIADVHFNPKVAEAVASIVEKVRINPGNYVDRKTGKSEYTTEEYLSELARIKDRIAPLIEICKRHRTVIRIGSNHGSLSERIMSRYGNTARGMVESAMEFLNICRELDFHHIVVSMKSSNTHMMIYASRLLAREMAVQGMAYPIHLGVTEAGEGEDGRARSAVGIGALLADGIGDTIRVSLTEDPVYEVPVARQLVDLFGNRPVRPLDDMTLAYKRRKTTEIEGIGSDREVSVWTAAEVDQLVHAGLLDNCRYDDLMNGTASFDERPSAKPIRLIIDTREEVADIRAAIKRLDEQTTGIPVLIDRLYPAMAHERLQVLSAAETGSALVDGQGDALCLRPAGMESVEACRMAYGILQAARIRFTRPEYISCPTCGRTRFNILDILKEVKDKTGHLAGLKIAVMGCIVNGPGEMADADYGYVGSGVGQVTLFKGQRIYRKNIAQHLAVDELIALIKTDGKWVEKTNGQVPKK